MNRLPHATWRMATAVMLGALTAAASAVAAAHLVTAAPTRRRARVAAARPAGRRRVAHIDVFKRIGPSVVHITTLATQREMFSANVQQVPRGTGSGLHMG